LALFTPIRGPRRFGARPSGFIYPAESYWQWAPRKPRDRPSVKHSRITGDIRIKLVHGGKAAAHGCSTEVLVVKRADDFSRAWYRADDEA